MTKTTNEAELLVLPGLIDCHVHFREPGATQKEDFESGARAALAGGITTVLDMPNTDPPTCTVAAFKDKIARAQRLFHPSPSPSPSPFDIRFFFGITRKEHLKELERVMENDELRKYVPGVKLYVGQSTGEQMVDPAIVQDVFPLCRALDLPLVCHCEDEGVIRQNEKGIRYQVSGIRSHSEIRSIEAAVRAVTRAIELARKWGTHLHIAHLSSANELTLIREAKRSGVQVTCEAAPHHLFLNIEDYKTLGTLVKVNPPLRTKEHCAALFEGLRDGTIDCIASDHAPHTLQEKLGRHAEPACPACPPKPRRRGERSRGVEAPLDAPSGVPGVETMLPLLLSCVFGDGPIDAQGKKRFQISPLRPSSFAKATEDRSGFEGQADFRFQVSDIVRLLYDNPNRIFKLGKPDKPPAAVAVNPMANWVIRAKELHSKCQWTPYEGWRVRGKVL